MSVVEAMQKCERRTDEIKPCTRVAPQVTGDEVDLTFFTTNGGIKIPRPDLGIRSELKCRLFIYQLSERRRMLNKLTLPILKNKLCSFSNCASVIVSKPVRLV